MSEYKVKAWRGKGLIKIDESLKGKESLAEYQERVKKEKNEEREDKT